MQSINFQSEGLNLKGNLFFPEDYEEGKTYPAIISVGSWTTVKEQMAGSYALEFSKQGFVSLAFDFRNFGESEGEPRYWENPEMKVEDIINAVSFLSTHPAVDATQISLFGVCSGAMYSLVAAAKDQRVKSIAAAASWLQDADIVRLYYGGERGIQEKFEAAEKAKHLFARDAYVDYVPTISTTDTKAAMYCNLDYYLNPERGGVKQWSADKFAVMSWDNWLNFDPLPYAKELNKPILMIHSDACVFPEHTKNFFEQINSNEKELDWLITDLESPNQHFNFYDREELYYAVNKVSKWIKENIIYK
ncbi:MAG: alpha/beta fold hydrolase [Marinifilaceae bacterium]|jgi:fermentation-respiration switch protein FrsA (DUF1100 family)|nr:alpha/beta fold hydrolase [Marinifilaceae bacterium]